MLKMPEKAHTEGFVQTAQGIDMTRQLVTTRGSTAGFQ